MFVVGQRQAPGSSFVHLHDSNLAGHPGFALVQVLLELSQAPAFAGPDPRVLACEVDVVPHLLHCTMCVVESSKSAEEWPCMMIATAGALVLPRLCACSCAFLSTLQAAHFVRVALWQQQLGGFMHTTARAAKDTALLSCQLWFRVEQQCFLGSSQSLPVASACPEGACKREESAGHLHTPTQRLSQKLLLSGPALHGSC